MSSKICFIQNLYQKTSLSFQSTDASSRKNFAKVSVMWRRMLLDPATGRPGVAASRTRKIEKETPKNHGMLLFFVAQLAAAGNKGCLAMDMTLTRPEPRRRG